MSVSPGTRPPRLCSSPHARQRHERDGAGDSQQAFRKSGVKAEGAGGAILTAAGRRLPTYIPPMKIGVLTAGGDCPGLNAVIRAVTRKSLAAGHEVVGLWRGYAGLAERSYVPLDMRTVSGILPLGGTILSTSSYDPYRHEDGVQRVLAAVRGGRLRRDRRDRRRAHDEHHPPAARGQGLPLVGVPKTIDNDVPCTDFTFGFDTAVQIATDAIDRLHTTAQSHDRVMVVEVMGRNTGLDRRLQRHRRRRRRDRDPGARADGRGDRRLDQRAPRARQELLDRRRRGGRGARVRLGREAPGPGLHGDRQVRLSAPRRHRPRARREIEQRTGFETRVTTLGHVQRGGTPTATDRVLATRYGVKAAELAMNGEFGRMAALHGTEMTSVPLAEVEGVKQVDLAYLRIAATFFG